MSSRSADVDLLQCSVFAHSDTHRYFAIIQRTRARNAPQSNSIGFLGFLSCRSMLWIGCWVSSVMSFSFKLKTLLYPIAFNQRTCSSWFSDLSDFNMAASTGAYALSLLLNRPLVYLLDFMTLCTLCNVQRPTLRMLHIIIIWMYVCAWVCVCVRVWYA